jgi:hypothetical protein
VGAVALVAATGHAMTARWHLGPVEGLHLWTILAFSPEILVFLFFMLTDPKTVPTGQRARVAFGVSVALLAAILVALSPTEFWAKVAVLAALTVVCAARPLAAIVPSFRPGTRTAVALWVGLVAYSAALVVAGMHTRPDALVARPVARTDRLPRVVVESSRGVDSKLDRQTALAIAADLQERQPTAQVRRLTVWLEPGSDQAAIIVARLEGTARGPDRRVRLNQTVEIGLSPRGYRIARIRSP